jgi:hypothetical protein
MDDLSTKRRCFSSMNYDAYVECFEKPPSCPRGKYEN